MKKDILALLLITSNIFAVFGQKDSTSIYKKLSAKKMYSVETSFQTIKGKARYELDGKKVSKSTYDKFKPNWKNLETCCPCLLKYYDKNDILLREVVSCTDCGVGDFNEFWANGQVKLSGKFKENNSGDWNYKTIQARGFCSVPDGKWTYYSNKGEFLYSEFWKNGEFIKQEPELTKNEIWKVDIALNGESIKNKKLKIAEVPQLIITPKFKNNAKMKSNFSVKFNVTAVGFKESTKTYTLQDFKNIDVQQILSEVGITDENEPTVELTVYNNNEIIENVYFTIVK
jgi:hypothetical protein